MADIQHFLINITKETVSVSEILDIKTINDNNIPYTYCFSLKRGVPVIGRFIEYEARFLDTNGSNISPSVENLTILFARGNSGHTVQNADTVWLNIADKNGNVIKLNSNRRTTESFLTEVFQTLLYLKGISDLAPFIKHFKIKNATPDLWTFTRFPEVKLKIESAIDHKDKTMVKKSLENITIDAEMADDPFQTIVGLEQVKREVRELIQIVKLRDEKIKRGLKYTPQTLHMVFTGNPGTGKTVVARIIAKEFKRINVLEKGHIVEVDRSKLVEKYVGHTAKKTDEVIQSAMGGVLFIDEAYSLVNRGENDFGIEVIDTLVKFMEDYRDKFVLIVAGYPDKMLSFLESNPGLASRFYKTINFPDYSPTEMIQIFKIFCQKSGYKLILENESELMNKLLGKLAEDSTNFGNARGVRKWFEEVERSQNLRVAQQINLPDEELMTIVDIDL